MKEKQFFYRCNFIFFVFAIVFLVSNTWNKAYATPMNEIQNYIEEFQKKSGVKNLSVVVYNNGNINYYENTNTKCLYQIGSMTKSFTGLGILKLINEGKLSLDDDISDLLDNFELYYNGNRARISVEELLRHTSGFTNSERDYPSANPEMSLMEWVDSISKSELKFELGSSYS
ncbi:MAG TPA: serine hydrolase domain-containing protein, partial [Defluviitaleaceae bacterium]|nr:serine hydrolase domain-containing protein [Defluviitaleaceae bacterium]